MRPFRALVIYLAVVFVGGALLAPWLYWFAQSRAHSIHQITSAPFHRFVDRSLLILALAGLWPLLRSLGATSLREVGLIPPYGQFRKFSGGLLLGFFSLAVVAGTAIGFGDRLFVQHLTAHQIVGTIVGAIGTAAIVATLEEILFRGGIFGGLRRMIYWPLALLVSSVIYAFPATHGTHRRGRLEFRPCFAPTNVARFCGLSRTFTRLFQSHARRCSARSCVSAHGQSLFLHRPARGLDFLVEDLRRVHRRRAARRDLVLGQRQND
jgi:membrane protease YdiL (CAAX protease family)